MATAVWICDFFLFEKLTLYIQSNLRKYSIVISCVTANK